MKPIHLLAACVLAAQAPATLAVTLYKCVEPGGKIAYADQPCAGGKAEPAKKLEVAAHETEYARKRRLLQEAEQERQKKQQAEYEQRAAQYRHDRQQFEERVKRHNAEREARAEARRQESTARRMSPEAKRLHALRCAGRPEAGC